MKETLTLPGEVYSKLVQGAAERGMTVEGLLAIVSDLVVLPRQPTDDDRQRGEDIDILFDRFRAGDLSAADRQALDQLINADYQAANARADRMIRAKEHRSRHGRPNAKQSRK